MRKQIISQESIDFQDGNFFKELTEAVHALRGFGKELKQTIYFNSVEVGNLSKVIKKHTNLNIEFNEGGPAIYLPTVSNNHIFQTESDKEYLSAVGYDVTKDIKTLLNIMEKKVLKGEVNLKNSTVSGIYEKMTFNMLMPREMFYSDKQFTNEEVAAIILHETGHAFTTLEFLSRTVTTNQVLSCMTRVMDKTTPNNIRVTVFSKGAELLKMSKEQQENLLNAKSSKEVTCIVIDSEIARSVSELGYSAYDVNSCEQLADQFATRHRAGKYLVTALDKLLTTPTVLVCIVSVITLLEIILIIIATYGLFLLILPFLAADKSSLIYDSDKARFIRIKLQNVENLKKKDLPLEVKKQIIDDNFTIDKVIALYNENLKFLEIVAYYVRPSYRNAHKVEILQKELERLGSSDLFTASAKLSTI
jgi:hypothetical protein